MRRGGEDKTRIEGLRVSMCTGESESQGGVRGKGGREG